MFHFVPFSTTEALAKVVALSLQLKEYLLLIQPITQQPVNREDGQGRNNHHRHFGHVDEAHQAIGYSSDIPV